VRPIEASIEGINDILYFQEKRNDELERLQDLVKSDASEERIQNCFKSLMRKQNQLRLIEDASIINTIAKHASNNKN
jgi:hypothetical protein